MRYFDRLDQVLQKNGYRLLLVNLTVNVLETSCLYRSCPSRVTAHPGMYAHVRLADESLPDTLQYAATVEAGTRAADINGARVKMVLFGEHVETILREECPTLWIMWNKFNGYHHMVTYLCAQYHVPYRYTEYGVLEGTLSFDVDGQMAESWVAQKSEEFRALPVNESDHAVAESFLELARHEKKSRKPRVQLGTVQDYAERARAQHRKVVFYAGQNDWSSGMLPHVLPGSAIHSPIYRDTLDALEHLSKLAKTHDWQILFKPHPLLEDQHGRVSVSHPERVDILTGVDIFECMELADVTVTILSQVSYLARTHGRPCVMLGRHQLSGKGCVYEATSRNDVGMILESALEQGTTPEQQVAWQQHVAQVIKYYVYAFDEETEALIGRGTQCATEELIAHARMKDDRSTYPSAPLMPQTNLPLLLEARFCVKKLLQLLRRFVSQYS